MDKRQIRLGGWALVWMMGCALWWWSGEFTATASTDQWTVPPAPPLLINGSFECTNGFTIAQNAVGKDVWIPHGWSVIYALGSPRLLSSIMSNNDSQCNPDGKQVSHMDGRDSWYLPSQDIATPPEPGKPFDLVIYQQVPATVGAAYSVSGWVASECGDNVGGPNPCPEGYYVAKMVGIDPNGGIDHTSQAIAWAENRTDRRWHGVYTSSTAISDTITIFIRVISPYQFHNNKGLVDAFTLVRAPLSAMNPLPGTVEETGLVEISWFGRQSADIERITGGNYDLLFDLQARHLPDGGWSDLVSGTQEDSLLFRAPCLDASYEFRVRARAEQPEDEEGVFPNHRYPGVWSQPQSVYFAAPVVEPAPPETLSRTQALTPTIYIPVAARTTLKEC